MSEHSRYNIVAGFLAIYLIWGSTYLAIRIGVETIPPFLMAGVRFLSGGAMLYWWARGRGAARPQLRHWLTASILGFLLAAGANGMVTYAEQTVPSGLTALLVAMVPMWIVMFDWLRPGGDRPRWIVVAGLVIGFSGVAMLINPTDIGSVSELDKIGAGLVVLATLMWALGSVYSRYAVQPQSKLLGASMQMLTGGVMLLVASLVSGETTRFDVSQVTFESWLALAYLAVIGSIAYAVYIWLLKASTPAKVATYAYVNPVIALVLGNLIAGELLAEWTLVCSLVILVAVALIVTARKRPVVTAIASAAPAATAPPAVSKCEG